VIGHGGMGLNFSGSVYHDNSQEAFQLALDIDGCEGIEMDVRLSKDGDLWAFHDDNLKKETNNDGCLEDKNFSDLNGTKYKGIGSEKLMRLKDMNLSTNDKRIFLDIKHYNACAGTIHDVNTYLDALNDLPDYFKDSTKIRMVLSNPDWIPAFLAAGYTVLYGNENITNLDNVLQLYPSVTGIVIKNSSISKDQVQQYLSQNKTVYIFEVRSPKKLREVRDKSPTGVFSDDVQSAVLEMK
jgi:glycerophosphoryl diester phosphodiesterase